MLKPISLRAALVMGMAIATMEARLIAAEADMKLAAFFRNYLEADCRLSPMRATRLGDHRFDHLLDDVSTAARKRRTELARHTLKEMPRQVDYAKLSRACQVDYEILRHDLETGLWLDQTSSVLTKPTRASTRAWPPIVRTLCSRNPPCRRRQTSATPLRAFSSCPACSPPDGRTCAILREW